MQIVWLLTWRRNASEIRDNILVGRHLHSVRALSAANMAASTHRSKFGILYKR